ncbi:MAG: hypothetical protein DWH91_14090 [Planctomycetota bacterium]|nr:MAG: hypothetical protein DWH91_14090 [Planctomycetota bacterium]
MDSTSAGPRGWENSSGILFLCRITLRVESVSWASIPNMAEENPVHLPFRVVVAPDQQGGSGPQPDASIEDEASSDEAWSLDDLEAAYQQALESLDSLEDVVAEAVGGESPAVNDAEPSLPQMTEPVDPVAPRPFFASQPAENLAPAVNQRQVVEALLFVGGAVLPTRKLADLLSGSATPETVLELIEALNQCYADENRPYRIQIAEGGCRMQLLSEFEKVRHRVYGIGPRDVKLSQEVLEILAFIAYSQPVDEERLSGLQRETTLVSVRQLLRRDLVQMERDAAGEVQYKTTPRFLELFGLGAIDDLPLPSDLAFK